MIAACLSNNIDALLDAREATARFDTLARVADALIVAGHNAAAKIALDMADALRVSAFYDRTLSFTKED